VDGARTTRAWKVKRAHKLIYEIASRSVVNPRAPRRICHTGFQHLRCVKLDLMAKVSSRANSMGDVVHAPTLWATVETIDRFSVLLFSQP
jgi:hypothetical protein